MAIIVPQEFVVSNKVFMDLSDELNISINKITVVVYSKKKKIKVNSDFKNQIFCCKKQLGISFLDVSTGEYLVAQGNSEYIDKLLQNFNPSEVLVQKHNKQQFLELFENRYYTFYLDDWVFQPEYANETLQNHFEVKNLKGFGIQDLKHGIIAAGAVLYYLSETQHNQLKHIQHISRIAEDNYVWMDR
mgnify:CR=1 FL=1